MTIHNKTHIDIQQVDVDMVSSVGRENPREFSQGILSYTLGMPSAFRTLRFNSLKVRYLDDNQDEFAWSLFTFFNRL